MFAEVAELGCHTPPHTRPHRRVDIAFEHIQRLGTIGDRLAQRGRQADRQFVARDAFRAADEIIAAIKILLAALADQMADTVRAVERLADGSRSELRGRVTISAPPAYAASVLAARLAPLRIRHPNLAICLLGEAHSASLARREADIAIRLSRPEGNELTAMRIGTMPFQLYGSAEYLATTPKDDWVFIGSVGAMASSLQQAELAKLAKRDDDPWQSDQVDIQAALAAAGSGVALLPEFLTSRWPDLVRANAGGPMVMRDIWLTLHTDIRTAAPVRAVIDALSGVDRDMAIPSSPPRGSAE